MCLFVAAVQNRRVLAACGAQERGGDAASTFVNLRFETNSTLSAPSAPPREISGLLCLMCLFVAAVQNRGVLAVCGAQERGGDAASTFVNLRFEAN